MNIKKMSGTLAVVAVLLGMNSVAMADCDSAILSMQGKANELKGCGLTGSDTDTLVYNDLIWKWKGSPDCAVNYKLAKSLYVERIEGGIPPKTKKGKPQRPLTRTHRTRKTIWLSGPWVCRQRRWTASTSKSGQGLTPDPVRRQPADRH